MKGPDEWGTPESVMGFADAAGQRAELLVDEEKALWRILGQTEQVSALSLLRPDVCCALLSSLSKESADQDGEGQLAGGGLILDSNGQPCFAWQEEVVGSRPDEQEIEAELNKVA
mmetsp:Transcript_535/g.1118  ORF Transcript_535/g.1118 Transcript_535/m.1118 type:complete len:115 (-) Transcript_535:40-384(-)